MATRRLSRDRDRLVQWTDAIVAIAITLLVLPLVDLVGEAVREHTKSVAVITDNWPQIYSFLLSFGVIALFWQAPQHLFEQIETHNGPLRLWNLLWILTIVALPFPTEMVAAYHNDRFTVVFYVGTMLLSSMCLTAMAVVASHNSEITGPQGIAPMEVRGAMIVTGLLALVLLLVAVLPEVTYLPLVLLVAAPVIDQLQRRGRPDAGGVAADPTGTIN